MPQYSYRAINEKGRSVRGQMNATNETDLFQQLHELGLELVDAAVVKERKLRLALAPLSRRAIWCRPVCIWNSFRALACR